MPRWACRVSTICVPMVSTGIERGHRILEDDGELGPAQAAQRLGRQARRGRGRRTSRGRRAAARLGSSCRMARDSMVLPQPDSPTMPSVLPGARVRSTPSTARKAPRGVGRSDRYALDRQQGCAHSAPGRWIGERAQRVADDVEGEHGEEHEAGRQEGEPRRDVEALAALADHAAPARASAAARRGPRKDSAPSTTMVTATPSRKKASSGSATLGSSSRIRMRRMGGAERAGGGDELALARASG